MHKPHSNQESCPLGIDCPWYQEVSELKTLVITDPLTGLFNMRHFEDTLEKELERTQRTELPTGLIMVDLDFFKKINDNWGHEVGNLVLKKTSQVIQKNTRALDIHCRYGGEEFAVICPSSDLLMTLQVANRIHKSIANLDLDVDEKSLKVTASLGIAIQQRGMTDNASQLIKRADAQLYKAKEQGRNQVCYESEIKPDAHIAANEREALSNLFSDLSE